jgi:hypothetical protein
MPGGRGRATFFRVSWSGSGQGRQGIDRGDVHGYGYRARAHELGVIHSDSDFNEICPPSARSNARMNFKFEFFENCHRGWSRYFKRILNLFLF